MSGFGVPVRVEGMTDMSQGLINIQRSLSDLFSKISEVSITSNLVIDAEPFLNSGAIGSSGTISAATMASTGLLGGPAGFVAGVVTVGSGLSLVGGNTLVSTSSGGSVTLINTTGPGISGGPISTTGNLAVQWNAGQVTAISNRLNISGGTLDVLQVLGVSTNTNAAAGIVGEFVSSTVASGSAVALTSGATSNVTSLSLTAGDWDVGGTVGFVAGASTTMSFLSGGVSQTSATMPVAPDTGAVAGFSLSFSTGGNSFFPVGVTRISLAAPATVFLVANATFAAGTLGGYGFIGARRRR